MEKLLADKYGKIGFTDAQIQLFAEIIRSYSDTVPLLNLIVSNTPSGSNPNGSGITKTEIQEQLNLSKHACNNALYLIIGAGLVCYKEVERKKYYYLTGRGVQVVIYLKQHGYLREN